MGLFSKKSTGDIKPKPLTDLEKYQQQKRDWEKNKQQKDATPAAAPEEKGVTPLPANDAKPEVNIDEVLAQLEDQVKNGTPLHVDLQNLIKTKFEAAVQVEPAKGPDGKEIENIWEIRIPITLVAGPDKQLHPAPGTNQKVREIFGDDVIKTKIFNPRVRKIADGSYIYKMNLTSAQMSDIIAVAELNGLLPGSTTSKAASPDDSFDGIVVVPKEAPVSLPPTPTVKRWTVSADDINKLKVFAVKAEEERSHHRLLRFDSWYANQLNKDKVTAAFYGGAVPSGSNAVAIMKEGANYHIDNVPDSATASLFKGNVKIDESTVPRRSLKVS
jgi:hypothetical protein